MSQEVIANVDALASGPGQPFHESQVDLVNRLGSNGTSLAAQAAHFRLSLDGRRCLVASLMWGSLMSFRNLVLSWS
jgi:hypothetical protein